MARNRPVRICIIKHNPRSEPKFHHAERFLGEGRSTRAPFAMDTRGWVFRMGPVIMLQSL